ncbi:hypothetical protein ACHAXT_002576 [Thalassiosira profunda]
MEDAVEAMRSSEQKRRRQQDAAEGGGEGEAPPAQSQTSNDPSAAAAAAPSSSAGPGPPPPAAPPAPAAPDTVPPAPKATRITKEAKAALYAHFTRIKWPRNKQMPKVNTDSGLDAIITRFGLERKQASRQLRNWKGERYDNSQVKIILNPEDIEATINDSISMSVPKFVTQTLDDIYEKRGVKGSADATLFHRDLQEGDAPTLQFIRDHPAHGCNALLVEYMRKLNRLAGELFPKGAAELAKVELQFLRGANEAKRGLVEQWKGLHSSIALPDAQRLSPSAFGYFGVWLFNCMFAVWQLLLVEDEKADIEIPTANLVGKYSRSVVYYVAGWALQRTSLALLAPDREKAKYHAFAKSHCLSKADAKAKSLPCALVELKEKKKLFYVTPQFYDFVARVESVYIANLSLRMMMAHSGGDLVKCINDAIRASDFIRNKFFELFGDDGEGVDEAARLQIMNYILDRYIHMRGRWFVKFMKDNTSKSVGETRTDGSATRTRVAFAHKQSKAVNEALKKTEGNEAVEIEVRETGVTEKQFWSEVEQAVLEYEDDDDANESDGAEDYEYNSGDED